MTRSNLLVVFIGVIPIALSCPGPVVLSTAGTRFKQVDNKPPDSDNIAVVSDQNHLRFCMKECLLMEDCLTTVFDSDLAQCDLYNSTSATGGPIRSGQTVVKRDERRRSYRPGILLA